MARYSPSEIFGSCEARIEYSTELVSAWLLASASVRPWIAATISVSNAAIFSRAANEGPIARWKSSTVIPANVSSLARFFQADATEEIRRNVRPGFFENVRVLFAITCRCCDSNYSCCRAPSKRILDDRPHQAQARCGQRARQPLHRLACSRPYAGRCLQPLFRLCKPVAQCGKARFRRSCLSN